MTVESPWNCKEIKPTNPKGNQPWIFTGRTNAEAEAPMLWLPDIQLFGEDATLCWERLRTRGEGGDRGWDVLMASLTQWAWDWLNSRRQWRIGKPGVVQSMGLQRVGHYWATENNKNPINNNWHFIVEYIWISPMSIWCPCIIKYCTYFLGLWCGLKSWKQSLTNSKLFTVKSLSCIWLFVKIVH